MPSRSVTAAWTNTNNTAATSNNKTCNCCQKDKCTLDGNYLQPSVIYQATITRKDNNTTETYIGLSKNFRTRYSDHTTSFRHAKHRNSTELSKHFWTLKDNNIEHFISWSILSSHSLHNSSNKRSNLCLKEKFLIICWPEPSTLNKRNQLMSSYRHRNKALLCNNATVNFTLHKLDHIILYISDGKVYSDQIPWWVGDLQLVGMNL